jgi:protein transport protein SEC61 subunit alpha
LISSRKIRGIRQPYPVKLFYTSNIPIILELAFVHLLYFVSFIMHKNFEGNFLVSLLGKWTLSAQTGTLAPVGGLAYYVSPPTHFTELLTAPFHTIIYIGFILGITALFSGIWINVSGSNAKDVTKQLTEQDMIIEGMREDSMVRYLAGYIPIAASFGGMCIGALCIFADLVGAIGSGTGAVLAITIVY